MVMKTEREGKYKAIQRYNKIMNIVGIGIAVLITVLGALGMVWFIREYS
jgi:hypothetical protein